MTAKLIPYLVLNGNAREAIAFYEKALDGQVLGLISFGDMPANPAFPIPEEAKNLVSHATVKVGDSELMFSDTFPGQPHQVGNNVTVCITTKDASQSKKFFEALQEGGQVHMPLGETDFSPAYALVMDKFGTTFHIYTEGQH
jgi:PhnB protein